MCAAVFAGVFGAVLGGVASGYASYYWQRDLYRSQIAQTFFDMVASKQMLQDTKTLIQHGVTHGDNAVERFVAEYKADMNGPLNSARRRMEQIYSRVQDYHELGVLDDKWVAKILEPGSVCIFMKYVQPLSDAKPDPKPSIGKQRNFFAARVSAGCEFPK